MTEIEPLTAADWFALAAFFLAGGFLGAALGYRVGYAVGRLDGALPGIERGLRAMTRRGRGENG